MYPFALIGNCQAAALVDTTGSLQWLCFPRPDSEPVFGKLIDQAGGEFAITSTGVAHFSQEYMPNSPVLVTTVTNDDGSSFKITDFSPRFIQHGRIYRPNAVFRIVEPISGSPTIKVSCKPVLGWSKKPARPIRGNSHIRYDYPADSLRLVSNMPMTYLVEERAFSLKETVYFGLTWSYGIEDDLPQMSQRFLSQTLEYWDAWVKHCNIPTLYQSETIRSAITLKLHCFEDTGSILAALTTSLPEEAGGTRNWDYRYCWLRDAYYVLSAFHKLGHFEEMEGFIKFLLNIAETHDASNAVLHPVYRLDQTLPLPEVIHPNWGGYLGTQPVRSANQAAEHVQNDVYGEMVLTLAPIFLDERFRHLRTKDHEKLVEHLGRMCLKTLSKPDAGLWEIRDGWQEHSFSNLMCWAGLDRISSIHQLGYLNTIGIDLNHALKTSEQALRAAIVSGSIRNGPKDQTVDSSLLQVAALRFPDQEVVKKTVRMIQKDLSLGTKRPDSSFLYRYRRGDDFGTPQSAFLICSFWLVQALVRIGETEEALQVMEDTMKSANSVGLFAEHFFPGSKLQTGNFPQAYSHVGQINAAFAISPPWEDLL
jgi:GH15 family glucan-1,4-alpha-glucosidase